MNKKLGKIVIALVIILVLGLAGYGVYRAAYGIGTFVKELPTLPEKTAETNDARTAFDEKLDTLLDYIDYYYYEEADKEAIYDTMLHATIDALGDPYSTYYNPDEYADLWESSTGIYSGIGATISQDRQTLIMTVVTPFANAPAYEAGMRPGDILVGVDGEDVQGQDLTDVVSRIKGPEGTTVVVTVLRGEKLIDLTITRRSIETEYVSHKMLDNGIGYILMSEFESLTGEQFCAAVDDLAAQGMKGLIIDLRGNPGGLLNIVCDCVDRILPKDSLIVYTIDKYDKKDCDYAKTDEYLDLPMVVLVNGYSASASEIFAGAMKDYGKATIVGTTTFGKGIVQTIVPIMSDFSGVKLTTSHYYTPSGVCIHGIGIEPDVTVELEEGLESELIEMRDHDNQIDAAVEVLMKQIK